MILQEKIKIKVNPKNLKYYQRLGYNINSCVEIEIPIEHLQIGSSKKIKIKCDVCDNIKYLTYKTYNINIKKTGIYCCCEKCANIKRKKTNLEKYGNENIVCTEHFKNKSKETKKEKYNDENYTNREKFINTCIDKYNCINVFQSEIIKNKSKETKKEKYDDEYFINKEKTKKTKKEKYNDEYYNNHKKYKQTCRERYGVENTFLLLTKDEKINNIKEWFKNNPDEIEKRRIWMSSENFKNKSKQTCIKKYGVDHPMHINNIVLKNHISGYWLKKFRNTELYYRGTYEKDFLDRYYDVINIEQGKNFYYYYNNKKRMYFSDFYIKEIDLIIEIKSSYTYTKFLDINNEKQKEVIKQGHNFIFIIDKDYSFFNTLIKKK